MLSQAKLEETFKEFSTNTHHYVPDGIVHIDLAFLGEIGLLDPVALDQLDGSNELLHYFHVVESPDKVTLFNDLFVIWIAPKLIDNVASTLIFISRIQNEATLHLELIFATAGVYNTPKYILKTLEHFLKEIIDNEAMLLSIKHPNT